MSIDPGDCTDGDIRLVDGIVDVEGRPEVCINGVWGSVCQTGWTIVDTISFCAELGYFGTGNIISL